MRLRWPTSSARIGEQLAGGLDRQHARRLVEAVAHLVGDLRQDHAGGLAVRPAHQRLVTPHPLRRQVDDRLKSHLHLERDRDAVVASGASGTHKASCLVIARETRKTGAYNPTLKQRLAN